MQSISDFLDEREEIIEVVRHDLGRGLKNPETGRSGLTLLTEYSLAHCRRTTDKVTDN